MILFDTTLKIKNQLQLPIQQIQTESHRITAQTANPTNLSSWNHNQVSTQWAKSHLLSPSDKSYNFSKKTSGIVDFSDGKRMTEIHKNYLNNKIGGRFIEV